MSLGPFLLPPDNTDLKEILSVTLKDIQKPTTVRRSELVQFFYTHVWSFLFMFFFSSYLCVCDVHTYAYIHVYLHEGTGVQGLWAGYHAPLAFPWILGTKCLRLHACTASTNKLSQVSSLDLFSSVN